MDMKSFGDVTVRNVFISGLAATLLAMTLAAPASALPVDAAASAAPSAELGDVQFRQHRGFGRHGFGPRRFGDARRSYDHRGMALGAGLAGLAAGAIIGSAISGAQTEYGPAPVQGDADAYCASRFRSYDPGSGTYMGFDGRRHSCP